MPNKYLNFEPNISDRKGDINFLVEALKKISGYTFQIIFTCSVKNRFVALNMPHRVGVSLTIF